MHDEVLTPERIVEAAEEVLRRFGLAKTTVVDVARVLNVSHGSIYRHFPSKAALREAVAERWLSRKSASLITIVQENSPASERLRKWFTYLIDIKRRNAIEDPELYATYIELANEARTVVTSHVDELVEQITRIIADGVAQGEFLTDNPHVTAQAVLDATYRFHDPRHVAEWSSPTIDTSFEAVWALIMAGLKSGVHASVAFRREITRISTTG